MKKKFVFYLLLILSIQAFADERADSILKAADKYRTGWESFIVRTRIINYKNGAKDNEGNYEVLIKGLDKSLVRFLNPDQKGQYLLMLQDKMWLYMPNTRRPIRVTPLQRLMGDASNGDVARTNFARDYEPKLSREESVSDKDCYVLELKAKSPGATYKRAELWVEKTNLRPVKAEIYLASGKHYKSLTYDEFKFINGRSLLVKMTIYDHLRPNRYTIMEFSQFKPKEIPAKYFNKNYLSKLK